MRFLCLHGRGTNADILEKQLAPFVSRLSDSHSFDFVDAPHDSAPAPGVSGLYSPPYLAWHDRYEPQHVQPVHDYLWSIIEEDGPYDGVIGFSQGAALAASFLLCHEYAKKHSASRRHAGDPFKVAIFFNSVMLISPSESIGIDIGSRLRDQATKHDKFLRGDDSSSASSTSTPSSTHSDEYLFEELAIENPGTEVWSNVFGFPPEAFHGRIETPTLHIIGKQDQFAEHSHTLVELCRPDKAETILWDGGHEIPRTTAILDECAEIFELVTMMASV